MTTTAIHPLDRVPSLCASASSDEPHPSFIPIGYAGSETLLTPLEPLRPLDMEVTIHSSSPPTVVSSISPHEERDPSPKKGFGKLNLSRSMHNLKSKAAKSRDRANTT